MTSNMLVDDVAELGSEEDEDFDEEAGEARTKSNGMKGGLDDSSEEEDEDDDEEAAAAVREGFIVDEEDDDEDERRHRRRERKKRRREEREEEDQLDEEDLDLIGETSWGGEARPATKSKLKRLKRGHDYARSPTGPQGVEDLFDEDDDLEDRRAGRDRGVDDEFGDFIEEDVLEEDEELREELEVARPGRFLAGMKAGRDSLLDEAAQEDYDAAFGDGTEYDWALALQEEKDNEREGFDRPLELKDVFEPSQLKDRMLTDEDNEIRLRDVPERYQVARKPFKELVLSEEELAARIKDEAVWISNLILPKKSLTSYYTEPFRRAVAKVLEFINVEDYEVPFIFQHRKDYLIHSASSDDQQDDPDAPAPGAPERLLVSHDLWDIVELDLKYRGLAEKRDTLQRLYENLKQFAHINDEVFEELLPQAEAMEEVQDIQDYLHFQYAAEMKDMAAMTSETNGVSKKRAVSSRSMFDRLRASKVYNFVRAFGITPDNFAQNVLSTTRRNYTEDPSELPEDLADSLLDPPEFVTGSLVLKKAKEMCAEEFFMSPRVRKLIRSQFYPRGRLDCLRTEKGLRQITEDHRYYEFKYLRGQDFTTIARHPEQFLRMLKAEQEGLLEVKITFDGWERWKQERYKSVESDNYSDAADAWNALRREVLDMALNKLERYIARGVKEHLKAECETVLARTCRDRYQEKLDQAPYKPRGMVLGTIPRVLALSNGDGNPGRDATCWAWVEDDGRVVENGKFSDLRLGNRDKLIADGRDVAAFVELVQRRKPDVIALSGFSVETRKLYKDLQDIVDKRDLRTAEFDDDGREKTEPLEVCLVNDEVARLYRDSLRAEAEHPKLASLTRYCVALARYMQSPLKEYAALGKDIISISFDPNQDLLPQDKLLKQLETAMVDMVNLVGVDINEAMVDPYQQNLLPYVCGLGPRKASQMIKVINMNGGMVSSRGELAGDPDKNIVAAVGPKVFVNCVSFLIVEFDQSEPESDYLDNTRVHPEDYELGRKMAADALDFDEEDVKAEIEESGPAAVVRKLIRDDQTDRVNDLALEEYALELERQFNLQKRATLETIRAELQQPYEELRRNFAMMSTDEIFTMLTGYTRETLAENMVVPVKIRRIFPDHIETLLDCGIEGGVSEAEFPEGVGGERGVEPRSVFSVHQTVQAKILFLNRKALTAQLSLREDAIRRPYRKEIDRIPGEWDQQQEDRDKKEMEKQKEIATGRPVRVVKHPLFHAFNANQAEQFLGSQGRGDVVIRPSSKGYDHLAVTWKVHDNVYQHLDVLELDKENEFSLGKTLTIAGKYKYSDLDELIVNHVKAMAKKVDEMMGDEKYQGGSKSQTEQWLSTYTEANPKRSVYAFCINPKFPGYFYLCFKAGKNAQLASWPVKVVPNAFELQKNQYPDMRALKNGFKLLFANSMQNGQPRRH